MLIRVGSLAWRLHLATGYRGSIGLTFRLPIHIESDKT